MKTRLILATLAALVAFGGCAYQPIEACNRAAGAAHQCQTIWVPIQKQSR